MQDTVEVKSHVVCVLSISISASEFHFPLIFKRHVKPERCTQLHVIGAAESVI